VIGAVLLRRSSGGMRATAPMLSLRMFKNRGFADHVTASFQLWHVRTVFFLRSSCRRCRLLAPRAGLRVLPWTGQPMLLAPSSDSSPSASAVSPGRHRPHPSGRQPDVAGVAVDADDAYSDMVPAFHRRRRRHDAVLRSGRVARTGLGFRRIMKDSPQAPNAAFRELGWRLRIALSARSSPRVVDTSPRKDYVNGLRPAMYWEHWSSRSAS